MKHTDEDITSIVDEAGYIECDLDQEVWLSEIFIVYLYKRKRNEKIKSQNE